MLLMLVACGSRWELDALYGDTEVALPAQTYEGEVPDGGFGMAVTRAGARLVMAAPMAAQIQTRRGPSLQGGTGSFLGAGLATLGDDQILVGAPGAGRVEELVSGAVLATGEGLGGRIAARDGRWIATTHTGLRWDTGEVRYLDARPDALALLDDLTPVVGFARGDVAVRIGEDVTLPRTEVGSEEGFALLVGDVLGDGVERIAVGAPGLARVDVYDRDGTRRARFLGEGGRFGAALALLSPGVLYVGAPMLEDAHGALYRVEDGTVTEVLRGAVADDELGFAVWAGQGNVIVGAPGGAGAVGRVEVLVP